MKKQCKSMARLTQKRCRKEAILGDYCTHHYMIKLNNLKRYYENKNI